MTADPAGGERRVGRERPVGRGRSVRRERSSPYLRVAGRSRASDGAVIAWSLADGRRGRRWRAVALLDGVITHALLLEVTTTGRVARLELTTPAGMLTLHPEPDEAEIHGNVVAPDGRVRPLAFRWSPDHELVVLGRPIGTAVALHRRRQSLAVGGSLTIPVLAIDGSLAATPNALRVSRSGPDLWLVGMADGPLSEFTVDPDGLPPAEETWPLED